MIAERNDLSREHSKKSTTTDCKSPSCRNVYPSDPPFITPLISPFGRVSPVAGLAAAVIVNLVWIGFLGYGFSKLVELAFF